MSDYISREEAIMAVTRARLPDITPEGVPIANGKRSVTDCVRRLKEIPAADVRPVVRGRWIEQEGWTGVEAFGIKEMVVESFKCSVCGFEVDISEGGFNFCPNCSAEMKQEADDAETVRGEQDV